MVPNATASGVSQVDTEFNAMIFEAKTPVKTFMEPMNLSRPLSAWHL